jgi:hypothetical protein
MCLSEKVQPALDNIQAEYREVNIDIIQNVQYQNSKPKTLEYRLITMRIYHLKRGYIYISMGRDTAVVNIFSALTVKDGVSGVGRLGDDLTCTRPCPEGVQVLDG